MMKLTLYTFAGWLVGTSAFGLQKSVGFSIGHSLFPFVSLSPLAKTHLNGAAPKGPGNIERPENEFSRTYRTESVLGSKPRDYQISIQATEEERAALAMRFDLSNIGKLEAELTMRREPSVKGGANRGKLNRFSTSTHQMVSDWVLLSSFCFSVDVYKVTSVEVEGTVVAEVTQTCVRTNEDFDVDLEFAILAIVRPIASTFDGSQQDNFSELQGFFEEEVRNKKGKKKKESKEVTTPERNVYEMDMVELQRLLQDLDSEDDVIEDESIYSLDGVIGESNMLNAYGHSFEILSQRSLCRLGGAMFSAFLAQIGSVSKKARHVSNPDVNHWIRSSYTSWFVET
jgi:hypothetical protein